MTKKKSSTIESYQLKNGEKRYQFQVYIGTDSLTGKQKRTTKRGFKTLKEAKRALARIKFEIDKGTYQKEQPETYRNIYDLWVKQYEKTVEESTFVKTTGIFKNHILPTMSCYKIEKISIDVCQLHVDEWSNELKKFRMVKSYAAKVLDFAIKRGYIQTNPFNLVDMPTALKKKQASVEEKKENFYTREELNEFLSCLKKEDNVKAYVLFHLLSYTGMRKGEALALTWNDLDFQTHEIRINKAISRGEANKLYVKSTKTGVARTVSIDTITESILKEWRKQQKQDYLKLGFNTMKSSQLVFSNERNEYLQPTKTRKWIVQVQKKYNLKTITTHGLRHTHCSLLFEAGASIKEVQDRLGHSDVQTTLNIYAHVSKEKKTSAIQKFVDYVAD